MEQRLQMEQRLEMERRLEMEQGLEMDRTARRHRREPGQPEARDLGEF